MYDTSSGELSSADEDVELPDSYDIHWSASRKAEVVRAVRDGRISFEEARSRYLLSRREFKEWQKSLAADGEDDLDFELTELA